VGIKTPLDTESIALWNDWRDSKKEETTLALNKGKRNYLNKEDLGLSKNPKSNQDKGKML